jgi:hypothetical protein
MERFDGHVGALQGPLQQRPEIFDGVGVDLSIHVPLSMVDNAMDEIALRPQYEPKSSV